MSFSKISLEDLPYIPMGVETVFNQTVKDFYIQDPQMLKVPLIGLEIGGSLMVVTDRLIYDPQYQAWRIKFFNKLKYIRDVSDVSALSPALSPDLPLNLVKQMTVRIVGAKDDCLNVPVYYTVGTTYYHPGIVHTFRYRDTGDLRNSLVFCNEMAGLSNQLPDGDFRRITLNYLLHSNTKLVKPQSESLLDELVTLCDCEINGDIVKINLNSGQLTLKILPDAQPSDDISDNDSAS